MRQLFKKNFHREMVFLPTPSSLQLLDDTTRYPSFVVGFPAVPVAAMLEDQKQLIGHIRATPRFDAQEFDTLVLPVIELYAAFVHLLPVSETHHHRGSRRIISSRAGSRALCGPQWGSLSILRG